MFLIPVTESATNAVEVNRIPEIDDDVSLYDCVETKSYDARDVLTTKPIVPRKIIRML